MSDSIEVAKRRYSEELAAYTLEQWRLARSTLQAARANGDSRTSSGGSDSTGSDSTGSDSTGSSTSERRRSRSSEEDVQQERSRHFRAVDFAQKASAVNGTA